MVRTFINIDKFVYVYKFILHKWRLSEDSKCKKMLSDSLIVISKEIKDLGFDIGSIISHDAIESEKLYKNLNL